TRCSWRSAHLVQPPHGCAVTGVAEGLELGVPRVAEELAEHVLDGLTGTLGEGDDLAQTVLVEDDVAGGGDRRVVDAQGRGVAPSGAVEAGRRLLGHLVPHALPAPERRGELRPRARVPRPGELGTLERRAERLLGPVEGHGL